MVSLDTNSGEQVDCLLCKEIQGTSTPRPKSKFGIITASVFGITSLGIIAVSIPFLTPALRRICLPYVPATDAQISNVVKALEISKKTNPGRRLIDLGSGDGRIVFAAASQGFTATGVELNPVLVVYSRVSSLIKGLSRQTTFLRKDLFTVDYKFYDKVVVFGVDTLMPQLEEKFKSLQSPLDVIVCRFPLPDQQPLVTIGEGVDTVWLYSFNIE